MDQNFGYSELFCDCTAVLRTGATENAQHVIFRVEATRLSQRSNRTTHSFVSNSNEAEGHLVDRHFLRARLTVFAINLLAKLHKSLSR